MQKKKEGSIDRESNKNKSKKGSSTKSEIVKPKQTTDSPPKKSSRSSIKSMTDFDMADAAPVILVDSNEGVDKEEEEEEENREAGVKATQGKLLDRFKILPLTEISKVCDECGGDYEKTVEELLLLVAIVEKQQREESLALLRKWRAEAAGIEYKEDDQPKNNNNENLITVEEREKYVNEFLVTTMEEEEQKVKVSKSKKKHNNNKNEVLSVERTQREIRNRFGHFGEIKNRL